MGRASEVMSMSLREGQYKDWESVGNDSSGQCTQVADGIDFRLRQIRLFHTSTSRFRRIELLFTYPPYTYSSSQAKTLLLTSLGDSPGTVAWRPRHDASECNSDQIEGIHKIQIPRRLGHRSKVQGAARPAAVAKHSASSLVQRCNRAETTKPSLECWKWAVFYGTRVGWAVRYRWESYREGERERERERERECVCVCVRAREREIRRERERESV